MEKVSNRQIFFILFLTTIGGTTIISSADLIARVAGTGAWLSIIIAAVAMALPLMVLVYLGNIFPGKRLCAYADILLGKVLGKIVTAIYVLYFLGILSMFMRRCAEFIKNDFLEKTPITAIIIVLLLTASYAAHKSVTNIARLSEFFGALIIGLVFVIHLVMALEGDVINILPLFEKEMVPDYFKGSFTVFFTMLGLEILTVIPFSQKTRKSRKWYALGALFVSMAAHIFIVEGTFGILGVEESMNYRNALIVSIRQINVPYLQIFQRFDVVFIVAWMFAIITSASLLKHAVDINLGHIFGSKMPNIITYGTIIIAGGLAIAPENGFVADNWFHFLNYSFGTTTLIVIPLILFIVAKVKKIGKNQNEPQSEEQAS